MNHSGVFLLLVCVFGAIDSKFEKSREKCQEYLAVKDDSVKNNQFPYVGEFLSNDGGADFILCVATLISDKYAIVPAFCNDEQFINQTKFVRFGSTNVQPDQDNADVQKVKVLKFIPNPAYDRYQQYDNIALLELEKPLEINNNVRPACLSDEENLPDNIQVVSYLKGREGIDATFRTIDATPAKFEDCKATYENHRSFKNGLDERQIFCMDEQEVIQPPIAVYEISGEVRLVGMGLIATGILGQRPFVKTGHYLDWIEEVIWH